MMGGDESEVARAERTPGSRSSDTRVLHSSQDTVGRDFLIFSHKLTDYYGIDVVILIRYYGRGTAARPSAALTAASQTGAYNQGEKQK
jgi:hypothetical protein